MSKRRLFAAIGAIGVGVAVTLLVPRLGSAQASFHRADSSPSAVSEQTLIRRASFTPAGTAVVAPSGPIQNQLEELGATDVVSDSSVVPPPGFGGQRWISVALGSDTGAAYIENYWKVLLAIGDYNQGTTAPFNGISISENGDTPMSRPVPNGLPDAVSPTDASATSEIEANLGAMGLQPISITILHPRNSAPVVLAETSSPSAFVQKYQADVLSASTGDASQWDGAFVEVVDPSGNLVLAAGSASATVGGAEIVAPAYWSEAGIGTGS